jgi:polyisoprenoid-binding protein YceI
MKMRWLVILALPLISVSPSKAASSEWDVDPAHSAVQFSVRHLGISNVQGDFTKVSGMAMIDDDDPSNSTVTATVDMTSVDTRIERRDDDLKSASFFDVAKYPTMTFQSTKIAKAGDGVFKMTGNLTLHGVTKEVTFDVSGPTAPVNQMGLRRGAEATGTINRKDFGITADPMMVGEDIKVTIDVELVKPGSMPGRGAGRGAGDGRGPQTPPQ